MDAISPQHRKEASTFLQIALYEEEEFTTLHPLRVMDLIYTNEGSADFLLKMLTTAASR